ncbi:MAG: alkaline phosphatase [Phycisphaerae bacterium]|nr:alkaline phosphatase [Phycisphaerae bacterium]
MKNIKTLSIVFVIWCLSPLAAAEQFDYKMAQSPSSDSAISYYKPAGSDQALTNITDGQVKNVILCIGDGMGFNHVALARHRSVGADGKLNMERMPVAGVMRTHSSGHPITDSAAAGTALACGLKTNNGMIGMTPEKVVCSTILEQLAEKGWPTGLVATSAITHATPASFGAHVPSRSQQVHIAEHLLANRIDVMFGGGRKFFLPKGIDKGIRKDDRNLLLEATQFGYQVIKNKQEMLALEHLPVLGVFAEEGMTTFDPEPSLAQMSRTAIELLSKKKNGADAAGQSFFLMIEGSQVDWAAHANDTDRVVRQTLLFDMAVQEAIAFAQCDRHTLVIVTADHETGGLILKENKGDIIADWASESHTAADVPVYAFGPGSENFSGTLDNTDIPKRIAELTGIQPFPVLQTKCDTAREVLAK